MAKHRKKSLREGREDRKKKGKSLQDRIKTGQERSKGRMRNVVAPGQDVPQYRPKDGSHILDIIPYDAGKNDPIVNAGDPTYTFEYWAHTNVGPSEVMLLCLAEMYNKECPICEHRQKLREDGKDDDVWKKLFPKRRNLYNVVSYDRGEEEKGVQVYDVSYHYMEKNLMAISKKPSRGGKKEKTINFADPDDGRSITFTIEPAKSKNDYPDFVGHTFDDRDYKIKSKILNGAFVLDEIIHIPTYDEVDKTYTYKSSEKDKKRSRGKKDDDDGDDKLQELIGELEDLEDMEELEDFIEDNDLDIKIKKKDDEDDVKEKIEEALREEHEDKGSSEPDYNKKEIKKMKRRELIELIEDEGLDVDPDDAEDKEELQELIIEELGL